jgi:Gly-Xaa carboxypeptidase
MASQKSDDFLPSAAAPNQPNKPRFYNSFRNFLVLTTCLALSLAVKFTAQFINVSSDALNVNLCPQAEVLAPTKHAELWADLGATIGTDQFKARAVQWLGGAVRIP